MRGEQNFPTLKAKGVGKQNNGARKSHRKTFFRSFSIALNIVALQMKNKYAREYSDLKSLKGDEMSFQLHEAKYGWKMLVDFK